MALCEAKVILSKILLTYKILPNCDEELDMIF